MLAPQLAAMIAHHRRYLEFEAQAERVIQAAESDRTEATKQPAILEAISDGVVVSNTTGRIKFINSAAEYILGKSREQLLGRPIALVYGEIDSAEAIENLLVAFSRRDQPLPTFIETEEQAIQGRLIPWRNENKEWMGIIAVFRDVTREVKVERSRNDFISALSRELRAPLTIVKGYADLSTNGDIGQYTPEQLHVQQIIQSNSTRMATVLENALQVSDENRQRILPRFEKINPTQIIAEAIQAIVPIARLNGLELLQELKADLPLLVADAGHFRKILDNLLTNACRFTPPGGQITIRARVQAERTLGGVRPHLRLSVTDNGIGIPAIDHKRIFDPFYQAKNYTPTEPQRGMGMGLAIVKDLVELHHGRVWVESTVGEGSTFHVILPLTQES
jgi:PAS domain S-box-containing protein